MNDKVYINLKNTWKVLSEGLIKLPVDVINSWVESHTDELISKLKETYQKGYNTFIDDEIVFTNPYNNEEVRVPVNIQNKLANVNPDIETVMHYDKKENAIYLSAKTLLDNFKSLDKLKQYVKNGIQHELTHLVDPGRKFKQQKHGSFSELVNSDIEFPAFSRQYIELIKDKGLVIKTLNAIRQGKRIPVVEIAKWFDTLDDKNKKKFMNQLVKETL